MSTSPKDGASNSPPNDRPASSQGQNPAGNEETPSHNHTMTPTTRPTALQNGQFSFPSSRAVSPSRQNEGPGIEESASSPTTPVKVQLGPAGGSPSGDCSRSNKRGSNHDQGSSTAGQGVKKKRPLMNDPKSEPCCCVCGKKYGSWKAVFGHFRKHPDRPWRGAFPPPKFEAWPHESLSQEHGTDKVEDRLVLEQQLAPTLLNLANQTMAKILDGTRGSASQIGGGSREGAVRSQGIDLNDMPQEPGAPSRPVSAPTSSSSSRRRSNRTRGFDLNLPPPRDDINDNGDGGNI